MSKLFFEIFNKARSEVFEKLSAFNKIGTLAGGTAVHLQLGKRYSYDFDIFTPEPIAKKRLSEVIAVFGEGIQKLTDSSQELSFITSRKVKVSLVHFPFKPLHLLVETKSISLFDLRDLASNKAYVIGRRGEYRDYVDMFFLVKSGLKLRDIVKESEKRFKGAFSERLFLEQLVYFSDLKDFQIDFLKEKYSPGQVKEFLQSLVENY